MVKAEDPFYNRKPVPDEFIEDVGPTGMSKAEELLVRERKYSRDGGDLRKFSNPKNSATGKLDPHYARKPVPDELIADVAPTGLTAEEEFLNRERKYSVGGGDLRKFSTGGKNSLKPSNDPFYSRKPVDKTQTEGVGELGISKAEEYEVRERKQSLFQLTNDPFQQFTGTGHRQSISAVASAGAADARRRSSAVAPHAQHDAATATANHEQGTHHGAHSGFAGETLAAIESRTEQPPHSTTTTTTTTTTTSGTESGHNQHGLYHDTVTRDTDDVGPTDTR